MKLDNSSCPDRRSLWAIASVLFLLGIVTRLPFQSQILSEHDAVNFALALENFDVRLHQPHPPGTFVFLIFLGRCFQLFLHDANASLVAVNILASGIAAAAIFILSSTWFDKQVGWVTSLLVISSPLVWYYSEVALSYTLEFAWVILLVMACFRVRFGEKWTLFASAAMMGLAGGIRPNTPFFLFPLWSVAIAFGVQDKKYSGKHLTVAFFLLVAGITLWAIPMVVMSGGIAAYWRAIELWLDRHLKDADNIWGTLNNAIALLKAILFCVGVGLFPLLWMLGKKGRSLMNHLQQDWRIQTLLLWIAPGAIYLIFIHFQRQGHTFTIMPAFVILSGLSIVIAGKTLTRFHRQATLIIAVAIVTLNSLFFLWGPAELRTRTNLRQYDRFVIERLQAIRDRFSPNNTVILARGRYGRLLNFYLRDYQEISLSQTLQETPTLLPSHVRHLVLFDDRILSRLPENPGFQLLSLPNGERLRYINWTGDRQVKVGKFNLEFKVKEH